MPELLLTDYEPHATQYLAHASPAKYRLARGAWRGGKTAFMLWELIHMAIRTAHRAGAGALFGLFRKTGPALTDTTLKDLLDLIPAEFIVPGSRRIQEGREELTIIGGTRVVARSLDDWRKKGGASYDAEFIDEAWELLESDFEQLKGRLSGRFGPRRMVLCTNPPTRGHWLYKKFVEQKQENMEEFVFTMLDNAKNLPADYVAEHLALEKTDPARYKRFVLGEWGFTTDNQPVYPEFREDRNVAVLQPRAGADNFLVTGWDFGYNHPAVVWGQILPTGHCNLLAELLGTNTSIRVFAQQFFQLTNQHFHGFPLHHYCDIAGRQKNDLGTSSVLELIRLGIKPRFRKLRVMRTVTNLQTLIGTPHLGEMLFRVHPRCKIAIEGFLGGYSMDPEKDEPVKDGFYDHVQDAIRYGFASALVGLPQEQKRKPPPALPRVAV